jgi:hypothetical protein
MQYIFKIQQSTVLGNLVKILTMYLEAPTTEDDKEK